MAYTGRVIVGNFKVIYLAPRHFFHSNSQDGRFNGPPTYPDVRQYGESCIITQCSVGGS